MTDFGPCEEPRRSERATSEALYARGMELAENGGASLEAAAHVEAAAILRDRCDPETVELFRMAARLYHYAGDLDRARVAMSTAGLYAALQGRLDEAAHARVDAAKLAYAAGQPEAALLEVAAAWTIAQLETVPSLQRQAILERFQMELPDGVVQAAARELEPHSGV